MIVRNLSEGARLRREHGREILDPVMKQKRMTGSVGAYGMAIQTRRAGEIRGVAGLLDVRPSPAGALAAHA